MERKGLKRKHAAPFKSPLQCEVKGHVVKTEKEIVDGLRDKLTAVNKQIQELHTQGYKADELQTHIDKLHEYNELKDVGQMVLGRIANIQGLRTKDIYEQYDLNLED